LAHQGIRTTVFIIRHGECAGNREGLFRGRCDFPLNETGIRQAQSLAREVHGMGLTRVFSSPLARAADTAKIVSKACNVEWQVRSVSS